MVGGDGKVLLSPWLRLGWGLKGQQIVPGGPPSKVNECNRLFTTVTSG